MPCHVMFLSGQFALAITFQTYLLTEKRLLEYLIYLFQLTTICNYVTHNNLQAVGLVGAPEDIHRNS